MDKFSTVTLWCFVVASGILLGGAFYETFVTQPMYFGDLPHSVTSWKHGVIQKAFFQTMTPGWTLLAVALLVCSFFMPHEVRWYARGIGIAGIVVMVATLTFFVPLLEKTQASAGAGLSGDEITRAATQFMQWNWLRMGAIVAALGAAIRALTLTR